MNPLVPIIGALVAGGDDVVVASGPEAAPIIEKTGARFALAGRSQADWIERLATRTRGNPATGSRPSGSCITSSLGPLPPTHNLTRWTHQIGRWIQVQSAMRWGP